MRVSWLYRATLSYDRSNDLILGYLGFAKPANHTVNVRGGSILAHLPFAFQTIDLELDTNDRLQLLVNVVRGRVAHVPGLWPTGSCRRPLGLRDVGGERCVVSQSE